MDVVGLCVCDHGHVHVLFRRSACASCLVSQGRIACANVLSDLYAMGVTECDNMLMLLSVSQKMNEKVQVPTPRVSAV